MEWKIFATAFVSIFVAEIGDKTQLAAFALAGGSSKWAVFFGASLALIAATGIAILTAGMVERFVPLHWLRRGAGALFIVIGIVLLLAQHSAAAPDEPGPAATHPS